MKLYLILAIFISITNVVKNQEDEAKINKIPSIDMNYHAFKKQFSEHKKPLSASGISSPDIEEQIFDENLIKINEHNKKYNEGKVSYYLGINQFSSWREDEFRRYFKRGVKFKSKPKKNNETKIRNFKIRNYLPSLDYRKIGYVTEIQDQSAYECSSCTVFAAIATIEGQYAKLTGKLFNLSEQYLIDCGDNNDICKFGGTINQHFEYLNYQDIDGIPTDENYPYQAKIGTCKEKDHVANFKLKTYENILPENNLVDYIAAVGPIGAYIHIADDFKDYQGGILDNVDLCSGEPNHAVIIVGYDEESYIFKNSFGKLWGENGYFRISRRVCEFNQEPIYPVIEIDSSNLEAPIAKMSYSLPIHEVRLQAPNITLGYLAYLKWLKSNNYKIMILNPKINREKIYLENLKKINEHNQEYNKGKELSFLGLNQFTHWTDSEFNQFTQNTWLFINNPNRKLSLPESLDYRKLGYLTKIKNQQHFLSSLVFSIVAALESQYFKITRNLISFSEQFLIDCSNIKNVFNSSELFNLVNLNNGLPSDKIYPYAAKKNKCKAKYIDNQFKIIEYKKLNSKNESLILEALLNVGPVIVFLSLPKSFQNYSGGLILNSSICSGKPNHAANLIGYDKFSYIFRNNWGTNWGSKGYFRVERKNCRLSQSPIYLRILINDIFKSKSLCEKFYF